MMINLKIKTSAVFNDKEAPEGEEENEELLN
jgi:hypothetical protein